jgi:nucleoside-diphosphate-sugar epimerase
MGSQIKTISGVGQHAVIIDRENLILVTGANGYLGSIVVRALLARGFNRIRCLTRPTNKSTKLEEIAAEFGGEKIEIVKGNLLSREICQKAVEGVSVIYHLAAGVEKSFAGCYLNSVVATRNLLDAALNNHALKRFVNTSSLAVYSNERILRRGLLDETCKVEADLAERAEAYTFGKVKQDEIVLDYAREYDLPYVIVRPSVVFGPGKAKITDRIGTTTFGVFLHLGHGNKIPLTFVDNCADAIVLAGLVEGIEGQVFNISDDDLPTSRQFLRLYKRRVRRFLSIPIPYRAWYAFCALWEKYSEWSGGQIPPVFNRRGCAVTWKGNRYTNEKAKKLLGWQPRIPMPQSLEIFFAYLRDVENHRK